MSYRDYQDTASRDLPAACTFTLQRLHDEVIRVAARHGVGIIESASALSPQFMNITFDNGQQLHGEGPHSMVDAFSEQEYELSPVLTLWNPGESMRPAASKNSVSSAADVEAFLSQHLLTPARLQLRAAKDAAHREALARIEPLTQQLFVHAMDKLLPLIRGPCINDRAALQIIRTVFTRAFDKFIQIS